MPFNINYFKANGPVYGGARPSLFNVYLSVPNSLGIDQVSVEKFTFSCKASELPAFDVRKVEIGYFGRMIKVAGDREIADWSVEVLNDEDFSVRSLFEKWSNGLNRLISNVRDPNLAMEQYKVDMDVVQYSKDGGIIRSYQAQGAWPMSVGAIKLDWDGQNQVEYFPVTFAVDLFVPVVESSDKKAGGVNEYRADAETDGPLGPS